MLPPLARSYHERAATVRPWKVFRTPRLARCYREVRRAVREWGPDVGTRYVQRVDVLGQIDSVDHLYSIRALHLHPLIGDRRGQHALRLTGRMRLLLTIEGPTRVVVEGVVDYHD